MPKLRGIEINGGFGGKDSLTLRNLPLLGGSDGYLRIIDSCNEMEKVIIESER